MIDVFHLIGLIFCFVAIPIIVYLLIGVVIFIYAERN